MKRRELQEGDKVRIISEKYVESLPRKGDEIKYSFTIPMREYCGRIATIEVVDGDLYKLDIDEGWYSWSIGMFEIGHHLLRNE